MATTIKKRTFPHGCDMNSSVAAERKSRSREQRPNGDMTGLNKLRWIAPQSVSFVDARVCAISLRLLISIRTDHYSLALNAFSDGLSMPMKAKRNRHLGRF
jgi:hypothetical protein